MAKRYIVRLTAEERDQLTSLVKTGKAAARKRLHAQVLLLADADGPSLIDTDIATACQIHVKTIERIRRHFVEDGLERALNRKKQERPSRQPKLDGRGQARLTALACSKAPDGRANWTLELLADQLVRLNIVDSISGETVRRYLQKTS